MDSQQLWQRYNKYFRSYPELGMTLDISRMRFDDTFLTRMKPALENAFAQMSALEKGEISNPDEGRMVGHYWLRTDELSPTPEIAAAIKDTNKKILAFAAKIHHKEIRPEKAEAFKNVVIVGIGGSALGPQLVADALGHHDDKMKIYFCDNTDPDGISRIIQTLGDHLGETLIINISKSGGTLETRNGGLEFEAAFKSKKLNFGKHAVAVTCPDSKLDKIAKDGGWLDSFYMWDWVGGRTSLFSAVGLLPAALQGIDIGQFLLGAREMDKITRVPDADNNPAGLLALMWHCAGEGKGKKDMVVLPYKDRLVLFSKYLQQLVMESLGKEKDLKGATVNQGIAVYGNKGSTDQHAYVQQLRDGLNNFFATFVQVLSDYVEQPSTAPLQVEPGITSGDYLTGFFLGTRRALYENQRDSITLTIDSLTPRTLGAMIALYERAVGLYASLVGINAYHQPGVEAGKKAAARVIDLQKAILTEFQKKTANSEGQTAEEISKAIGSSDDVETVYHVLEHLALNTTAKIKRGTERHPSKAKYFAA